MKRKAWKWIFGPSLAGLILLVLFTFGTWVLLNIGGAILLALMGNQEIHAMPMADFFVQFCGLAHVLYIFGGYFRSVCRHHWIGGNEKA